MPQFHLIKDVRDAVNTALQNLRPNDNGRVTLTFPSEVTTVPKYEAYSLQSLLDNVLTKEMNHYRLLMAIQYPMPLSSRVADVVCAMKDLEGNVHCLVIELKHWDDPGGTGIILLRDTDYISYKGGARLHPAAQALGYERTLAFNLVGTDMIKFHSCVYLSNISAETAVALLTHEAVTNYHTRVFGNAGPRDHSCGPIAFREWISKLSGQMPTEEDIRSLVVHEHGVTNKLLEFLKENGRSVMLKVRSLLHPDNRDASAGANGGGWELEEGEAADGPTALSAAFMQRGIGLTDQQMTAIKEVIDVVRDIKKENEQRNGGDWIRSLIFIKGTAGTGKTLVGVALAILAQASGFSVCFGVRNQALRDALRTTLPGILDVAHYLALNNPVAGIAYKKSSDIILEWNDFTETLVNTLAKAKAYRIVNASKTVPARTGFLLWPSLSFRVKPSEEEINRIADDFSVQKKDLRAVHGQRGRPDQGLPLSKSGRISGVLSSAAEKLAKEYSRDDRTPIAAVHVCFKGLLTEADWNKLEVSIENDEKSIEIVRSWRRWYFCDDDYASTNSGWEWRRNDEGARKDLGTPLHFQQYRGFDVDLLIGDEAQRAEADTKKNPGQYTRGTLQKSLVTCVLYDPRQVLMVNEIRTIESFYEEAKKRDFRVYEHELVLPIRVRGGESYFRWLNDLLRGQKPEPLQLAKDFSFQIVDSLERFIDEMGKKPHNPRGRAIFSSWTGTHGLLLKSQNTRQLQEVFDIHALPKHIRRVAQWKPPHISLSLPRSYVMGNDSVLDSLRNACNSDYDRRIVEEMYQEARKNWVRLDPDGRHPVWWVEGRDFNNYWHTDMHCGSSEQGIEYTGTINVAQGHEVEYVGIVWGTDLTWRNNEWQLGEKNYENDFRVDFEKAREKGATPKMVTQVLNLLKHRYFILLTRGISGVVLHCEDDETREYIKTCKPLGEAIGVVEQAKESLTESVVPQVMDYQKVLLEAGDTDCHTIAEALSDPGEAQPDASNAMTHHPTKPNRWWQFWRRN